MTIHLIRYCIKKFPDVTNRLRNRQDISSTDFLMERNCIFQVLTMKEQVLPAHIRKAKMDLYHNGSFLLLQNIESIDISCVPGMEYIENDEELYDREPFTVEEEKLRKEAVQELLIYQG